MAGPNRDGAWGKIAVRLVRRPAVTLGVGLVILLGLASFALGYHAGGFGGNNNAPAGSSAAAGDAIVASHFPHLSSNPANLVFKYSQPVWGDATTVAKAQTSLQASGQLSHLTGPLNGNGTSLTPTQYSSLHGVLGSPAELPSLQPSGSTVPAAEYDAFRASAQFVSADGRTIQFEAAFTAGDQQSTAALQAVPAVRGAVTRAAQASGAIDSGVAGQAAALYDVSTASNHDLVVVFPLAILAIGLLLALVLRSLIAPLYLIVSVALSYLAALGVATLLFIDIGGDGGITFILPFLMFIFLLALGEDYNILVMTRI
ncbi:MAG: MMPL family transporter, partial [Acidimicrobiales bacterium]